MRYFRMVGLGRERVSQVLLLILLLLLSLHLQLTEKKETLF